MMSNQPTDLERAQWWRDQWRRAYNRAADADRLTPAIARKELLAVVRYVRVNGAVERGLNTSREDGTCQA